MTAKSKSSLFARPKLVIPSILFLLGMALTLWMLFFVSSGVFFGSDAGTKALLSQQIASQIKALSFPLDVSLTAQPAPESWVNQLWDSGLYPITPPFSYELNAERFISFPFIFPLITAPFYALLGEPGLYVIPVLALWVVWGRFCQIGLRADWDSASLSLGLFTLIFASPLSLYGSTYWEQTVAIALAFWGISALLYPKKTVALRSHLSGTRLIISGVLIGLSVWFRPEFIGLLLAVAIVSKLGWLLPKWRLITPLSATDVFILIGSMVGTLSVFCALNYGIYGHPLGLHGQLLLNETLAALSLQQAKLGYSQMLLGFWKYFPIAAVAIVAALCSPEFKRASLKTTNRFKGFKTPNVESIGIVSPANHKPLPARALLIVCLLAALLIPLLIPAGLGGKQWGPRLYLALIPLLSVVVAEQLRVGFFQNWARRILLIGTAIALAFGIHMNTLNGAFNVYRDPDTRSTSLWANYVSVAPALAQIKEQSIPWIATSSPFVPQQFWSALPEKTFFYTKTLADVEQLANALNEQEESTFLFICSATQTCSIPEASPNDIILSSGGQVSFEALDQAGRYTLYKAEVTS